MIIYYNIVIFVVIILYMLWVYFYTRAHTYMHDRGVYDIYTAVIDTSEIDL